VARAPREAGADTAGAVVDATAAEAGIKAKSEEGRGKRMARFGAQAGGEQAAVVPAGGAGWAGVGGGPLL
jgi:hypothetical protein